MCLRTSDQIIIKRWFKCRSLICDLIFALRLKIVQEIEKQKLHFAFHCYILMSIKCCFNIILIFKISCNNLWCFLWCCWGAEMCFTFHDVRFWDIKLTYYFVTAQSNTLPLLFLSRGDRRLPAADAVLDPDRALRVGSVLSALRPPASDHRSDTQIHLPPGHRQHAHTAGIAQRKQHYITHLPPGHVRRSYWREQSDHKVQFLSLHLQFEFNSSVNVNMFIIILVWQDELREAASYWRCWY